MLIVEVSRGAVEHDRDVKAPLYAEAGVPDVWLVNLYEDCVEGLSDPVGSGYRARRRYERGERIVPVLLPGLSLEVDKALMSMDSIARKRYEGEGRKRDECNADA